MLYQFIILSMLSSPLLLSHVSLQSHNTFGIAAVARHYVRITELAQLSALSQSAQSDLPRLVLGGGSNLIFTRDFPGVVLHMALSGRECLAEDDQHVLVRAAAGENWHDFVQWTLTQGWGGLENLSLIPGSVGAAPVQNIGAYGVEINDVVHSVCWFEFASGQIHHLDRQACQFAYRDSIFKGALRDRGVIVDVTFALPKPWRARLAYGDVASALAGVTSPAPHQVSDVICAIRQRKLPDPKLIGNAGSFYKNPLVTTEQYQALLAQYPDLISYQQAGGQCVKLAAGWLIERAGWKGRALGQAGVYAKQALVLVNLGHATGTDVTQLAQAIQADVLAQFGVLLDTEPVFV